MSGCVRVAFASSRLGMTWSSRVPALRQRDGVGDALLVGVGGPDRQVEPAGRLRVELRGLGRDTCRDSLTASGDSAAGRCGRPAARAARPSSAGCGRRASAGAPAPSAGTAAARSPSVGPTGGPSQPGPAAAARSSGRPWSWGRTRHVLGAAQHRGVGGSHAVERRRGGGGAVGATPHPLGDAAATNPSTASSPVCSHSGSGTASGLGARLAPPPGRRPPRQPVVRRFRRERREDLVAHGGEKSRGVTSRIRPTEPVEVLPRGGERLRARRLAGSGVGRLDDGGPGEVHAEQAERVGHAPAEPGQRPGRDPGADPDPPVAVVVAARRRRHLVPSRPGRGRWSCPGRGADRLQPSQPATTSWR